MTSSYRYVFNTMRAERVLQEIDLYGVYMSMSMNGGTSQFGATCQLDQTGKRNEDLIEATQPGRTYVVVERNDIPVGAWIVWSRVYSAQSKTIQISGIPFDSYPSHQRILTTTTISNTEQLEIFKTLWTQMQSVYGRDVNVNVPSGVSPTLTPKSIDVQTYDVMYYGEIMSALANSVDGFDWYIAVTKEGNFYRKDLRIGFPLLGQPLSPGVPVFEYPGNVTQYYMTESMSQAGTNAIVLGAGEGEDMLVAEVAYTDLLDGGMPRWDIEIPRKDVQSQALLTSVAGQLALKRRAPVTTIKMTVKGDRVPEFGAYNLGDTTRVVIKDARNPGNGLQQDSRLVAWTLRPPTSEQVEEADLIFEGDELNG